MRIRKVLSVVLIACLLSPAGIGAQEKAKTPVDLRGGKSTIEIWNEHYGPFNSEDVTMLRTLNMLGQIPVYEFRRFQGEKLAVEIYFEHDLWLRRVFRNDFFESVGFVGPTRYYLNNGRDEQSTLIFEYTYRCRNVVLFENSSMILVVVSIVDYLKYPFSIQDFISRNGIDHGLAVSMLKDIINFPSREDAEIEKYLGLTPTITVGQSFDDHVALPSERMNDWKENILVFLSRKGLCAVIFKAMPGRASFSIPKDSNWLNKGLYKSDAVTLVDPPADQRWMESFMKKKDKGFRNDDPDLPIELFDKEKLKIYGLGKWLR